MFTNKTCAHWQINEQEEFYFFLEISHFINFVLGN